MDTVEAVSYGCTGTVLPALSRGLPSRPSRDIRKRACETPLTGPTMLPVAGPPSWKPGAEPIPGYRLLSPLGQGGFGQVWKCEAPGGLVKAIKVVGGSGRLANDGEAAAQERKALHLLKAVRHPFILSLDRVEVDNGALLVVMELADRSLGQLSQTWQQRGYPGVPRDDLLRYLVEAAEALDWMNFEHGLQHLDVKPDNLFLISDHVKIADFGLVHSLAPDPLGKPQKRTGGFTPAYASPEIWRGSVSPQSDQYSLAAVFLQLLTGDLPFSGKNSRQLMLQHANDEPDLRSLPAADQPVVARALAKDPRERYPSCLDFLKALWHLPVVANPGGWRWTASSEARTGDADGADQGPAGGVATDSREASSTRSRPLPEKQTRSLRQPPFGLPDLPLAVEPILSSTTDVPRRHDTVAFPVEEGSATADTFSCHPLEEKALRQGSDSEAFGSATPLLPGYERLRCLSQGPLGDSWLLRDADGRERRGIWPLNADVALQDLALLSQLRHPALPPLESAWDLSGRLVLLTELPRRTLKQRFEECRAAGVPGVPRQELLTYLNAAAEALDALAEATGLAHLTLNPQTLLLEGDGVRLADFGLAYLLPRPEETSLGEINSRYAAPELFDAPFVAGTSAADQYSLAVIYTEMLSGVRSRVRSTPPRPGTRSGNRAEPALVDLDLVPAFDRPALTRALHPDPAARFATCVGLLAALNEAGPRPRPSNRKRVLPSVLPAWRLTGETAPEPARAVPGVRLFLEKLAGAANVCLPANGGTEAPYAVHPDGSWESRYPIQLFEGALDLKLQGFCQQWHAQLLPSTRESNPPDGAALPLRLQIDLARGFWDLWAGRQPRLEVEVLVQPGRGREQRLAEVQVRLRSVGERGAGAATVLEEMGPRILESLRSYLLAQADQRAAPRLAFTAPLNVYPVLPDQQFGDAIPAASGNISATGAGFQVGRPLPADRLYLHWHTAPSAAHALLARVIRCTLVEGGYDVGVIFQ